MTSVLPAGRYKQKKEWSTSSIPELVSNAETNENDQVPNKVEIQVNGVPQEFQSARRSSLAVGSFSSDAERTLNQQMMANASEKHSKRRSSIAVAFLGRKDNAKVNAESKSSLCLTMKMTLIVVFD